MWTLIFGWLSSIWSKASLYILMAGAILGTIVAVYLRGLTEGKNSALQKQNSDALKNLDAEAKENARIQSLPDSSVRDQLRKRWSEH